MRRMIAAIMLGVALTVLTGGNLYAADCEFRLGFKTLRDLIGHHIVGECLENEHYNAIGDSNQQTTGGLMAWRKADNWTAFTDGYRTWINGPNGLVQRLNTERFAWEADYVPAKISTPTPIPTSAQSIDPRLNKAIAVMRTTETGEKVYQWLLESGADVRVRGTIWSEANQYRPAGQYDTRLNLIVLDTAFYEENRIERVVSTLVHEIIHAIRRDVVWDSAETCFKEEILATSWEAVWWGEYFGPDGSGERLPDDLTAWLYSQGTLGQRMREKPSLRATCEQYGPIEAMPISHVECPDWRDVEFEFEQQLRGQGMASHLIDFWKKRMWPRIGTITFACEVYKGLGNAITSDFQEEYIHGGDDFRIAIWCLVESVATPRQFRDFARVAGADYHPLPSQEWAAFANASCRSK